MRISFKELRQALQMVLNVLEEEEADSFDVPESYYWHIPLAIKFDVHQGVDTEDLTIGDLDEDLDFLGSSLKGNREPNSYDLVYLGKILQACGERGTAIRSGSKKGDR